MAIRGRDRGRGWGRQSQITLPCGKITANKGRLETGKDAEDKDRVSGLSCRYGFGFRFGSQPRDPHPNLNT
jgi:hypothetical protein